jgi:hypothetical protein
MVIGEVLAREGPVGAATSLPYRVWNEIFAAGDRRLKRDLKSMSPRRDRKLETTTREKSPQKKPS